MVEVLIATYNGADFLKEQLDSLVKQSFSQWRAIIRDDGSTDLTIDVIQSYLQNYPEKFTLLEDELGNIGSSHSFMLLLEKSSADFIAFCDQDDVWLPNKLELQMLAIHELEATYGRALPLAVFSDLEVVDENLATLSQSMWHSQRLNPQIVTRWKALVAQNVVTGCTMLLNKSAKNAALPFPFSRNFMIHDQWVAICVSKVGFLLPLNRRLVRYRQHGRNVAGAKKVSFSYFITKVSRLSEVLGFLMALRKHFDGQVYLLELIFYKVSINIKRIFK